MKKIQILAFMALIMVFGCSKDEVINTEQNSIALEESNFTGSSGERKTNPNNGLSYISFFSNSIINTEFVNGCLPTDLHLLKQGNFSGNITGFGKIKTSLSTYEIVSCVENSGNHPLYSIVAQGMIALSSRDYCSITITGYFDVSDDTSYGFVYGAFNGNATTYSGVGKLKGLDYKSFEVYSGSPKGPTINLDEGTMTLRISNFLSK